MNNEIDQAYVNALLADAAYVKNNTNPLQYKGELGKRMTEDQAQFISDNFEIVASYESNDLCGHM